MMTKVWPIVFLALLSGSNATTSGAAMISAAPQLRDPEIFQSQVLHDLLLDLSFDPDVRIAVDRAGLRGLTLSRPVSAHPGQQSNTPFYSGSDSNSLSALVAREGLGAGIDPGYMVRLANRESHFDPFAQSPTSSAAGLFQFTDNTWLCSLREFGPGLGIDGSDRINRTRRGVCETATPEERQRLLSFRSDPLLSTRVAAAFSLENYRTLVGELRRRPTATELYVLHFFGQETGLRFLQARLSTPWIAADQLAGEAAASNEGIFFAVGRRPRSVSEVFEQLNLASSVAAR
jgi:hypothetical protein